jgi:hypothetical protein
MTNQSHLTDAELLAIEICLKALLGLTDAARNRALAYLTERIAAEASAANGNNDTK